jgi:RNA recognition motif-containing protein
MYVGNLPYQAAEKELEELFSAAGSKIENAKIITDFNTGKSRGFAFIEVPTREELEKEVRRLNGFDFNGRILVVSEAKPRKEKTKSFHKAAARGSS